MLHPGSICAGVLEYSIALHQPGLNIRSNQRETCVHVVMIVNEGSQASGLSLCAGLQVVCVVFEEVSLCLRTATGWHESP